MTTKTRIIVTVVVMIAILAISITAYILTMPDKGNKDACFTAMKRDLATHSQTSEKACKGLDDKTTQDLAAKALTEYTEGLLSND